MTVLIDSFMTGKKYFKDPVKIIKEKVMIKVSAAYMICTG